MKNSTNGTRTKRLSKRCAKIVNYLIEKIREVENLFPGVTACVYLNMVQNISSVLLLVRGIARAERLGLRTILHHKTPVQIIVSHRKAIAFIVSKYDE
jgi:hypothetical protein